MNITKQKMIEEGLEYECNTTCIVVLDTLTFCVEAYSVLANTDLKLMLENLMLYDEGSNLLLSANKGKVIFLKDQVLRKQSLREPVTIAYFEDWVKNSEIPAKIMKILRTKDEDY